MCIYCINFYLTHTITTVAPDSIVNVPETVNGPANTALLLASILTFLFKGELPSKDPSDIREDRRTRRREQFNTSKEEVLNSDELANRNRRVGASASSTSNVVETVVREQRKIGRNEKVTIKNLSTGETKKMKFKQAEKLIQSGSWIIT